MDASTGPVRQFFILGLNHFVPKYYFCLFEWTDSEFCFVFFTLKDLFNEDTKLEYNVDVDNGIAMEGYLFKRASNAFKTWNR